MRILALDLGTKTGYAARESDRIICSGVLDLTPRRFDGGGVRFLRFEEQLLSLLVTAPSLIVFEEVRRHMGTDAAHVYGGLLAVLTATCERRRIPYQGVPVKTIKKHATGKGNADKTAMVAAAVAKGWTPADDNEADALWLADYAATEGFVEVTSSRGR